MVIRTLEFRKRTSVRLPLKGKDLWCGQIGGCEITQSTLYDVNVILLIWQDNACIILIVLIGIIERGVKFLWVKGKLIRILYCFVYFKVQEFSFYNGIVFYEWLCKCFLVHEAPDDISILFWVCSFFLLVIITVLIVGSLWNLKHVKCCCFVES